MCVGECCKRKGEGASTSSTRMQMHQAATAATRRDAEFVSVLVRV